MRKIFLIFSLVLILNSALFGQADKNGNTVQTPLINEFIKLYQSRNYEEIQRQYSSLKNPTDDEMYMAALSYFCVTNYAKTAEILQNVYTNSSFSMFPSQTELYASSLMVLGKYEEAVKAFEVLETNEKLSEKTEIDYATANYKIGKYEKSIELTKNKTSVQGLYICANSYYGKEDYAGAVKKYEELLKQKNIPEKTESEAKYFLSYSYCLLGEKAFAKNDKTNAINYTEQYLKTAPTDEIRKKAAEKLSSVYLDYKMYEKAISVYEPYLNRKDEFGSECMYKTAEIYVKQGNSKKAAETYNKVFEKFQSSKYAEESLFKCGEIIYLMSDYKNASKYFDKYAQVYPLGKYIDSVMYYNFEITVINGDTKNAVLRGKQYLQNYPDNTFTISVLQNLVKIYETQKDYKNEYDAAKKLQKKIGKDSTLEKRISMLEKILGGQSSETVEAEVLYEETSGSATPEGRRKGTELAKLYFNNDETKTKAFELSDKLLPLQQKNINSEYDYAAENAYILANYYYDDDKKTEAAENYLLAATYFRMGNNSDKAAYCLYTATECFMHLNKKGDAEATADLLKQLYPESRYASSVNNLLR